MAARLAENIISIYMLRLILNYVHYLIFRMKQNTKINHSNYSHPHRRCGKSSMPSTVEVDDIHEHVLDPVQIIVLHDTLNIAVSTVTDYTVYESSCLSCNHLITY